jgi:nucleoside-diphosphate-sugar epimerase
MLLLAPNGSICNVGNDEEVSVLDVAKMIQKIFDTDINIKIEKNSDPHYTTDNPQRRCPDLSLINSLVEYKPRIMFENGLKRVYDWYSGNLK